MNAPLSSAREKFRQKILIVDDLEGNLEMFGKLLKPLDVDLVNAGNGQEALEAVRQHNFAVIILDVIMPEMDGYALAKIIKEIPGTGEIPIIFITGIDQGIEKALEGYEIGAIDFILKPFAPKIVTSKVKALLEIDRKIHELEQDRTELKQRESARIIELEASQISLQESRENALRMMEEAVQAKVLAEENADRYHALFNNLPSGFSLHEMIYDAEGHAVDYNFLHVNPAFETLTGLKAESIIGKTVKEVLPDIEQHWIDLYADVVETGKTATYENYSKPLNKYFSVRAYRPEAGHFAVLFSDVTETKENAEKLKVTQFAVENLQDSVYWVNMQGGITYANNQACKELGYTKEEFAQLHIWDIDAEMTAEDWQPLVESIRIHKGIIYARDNVRKDGTRFPAEIKTTYLNLDGNELICGFAHNTTARNEAREKIVSSQRLLSSIIDTIPIRVFWKDRNSKYLGCNLAFAKDLGLEDPHSIIGKSDSELGLPASKSETYSAEDQKVIQSGIPQLNNVEEMSRPGKTALWLKTNKIPLTDPQGEILGVLGTYEDITESKQLQEAIEKQIIALTRPLEDSEEISFDELFNLEDIQRIQDEFASATNVASIITHPNGTPITQPSNFTELCEKIIRCTAKGCANCIISDAEFAKDHASRPIIKPCLSGGLWDAGASITVGGKHIASWLIGQVRDETQTDEMMRAYAREIGADEKRFIEAFHRVPKMSKERFTHIANALYTLANQLSTSAYQNMQQARFISDEKRRTKELRRLSTALEQSPEVIVITDTNGVIEYVNPAFEKSTGYLCSDAIGKKTSLLKSHVHEEDFYHNMWQTISSGNIWTGHITNQRKDGTTYTEDAVISPVKTPDGVITNYVAIKRDITQELIQEEKMQNSQKMEAVGQLAGGIAHDFNNIMQSIMGFSDLLLMTLEASQLEPREHVTEIQKAAQHAAELTRQLLAFSRKQHVKFSPTRLNEIILKTLSFINSIIGENIRVTTDLCSDLHLINADAGQLERAFLNMAINARDAMPRGGTLTLRTENISFPDSRNLPSPNAQPGEYVCLSICDTGEGISEQVIGHIFEPFFTTKPFGSGTGLGLAASYGIIRKHDGWIDVSSKLQEGTTFKIYLPIHLSESKPEKEPPLPENPLPPKGSGQRILIVEDADAVRILTEKILREAGYSVQSTSNAEDAEVLFEKEKGNFNLLFSDVILPDKNGADLAGTLQAKKPGLQVILCSGYSGNRIEQTGANLKDYSFLEKPYTLSKLLHLVHEVL